MSNKSKFHGPKVDIEIRHGNGKRLYSVVASVHNSNGFLKEDPQQILEQYFGFGEYNSKTQTLTVGGLNGRMVHQLCCQPYARTIDTSGLHDAHTSYKIHHDGHQLGITVR